MKIVEWKFQVTSLLLKRHLRGSDLKSSIVLMCRFYINRKQFE